MKKLLLSTILISALSYQSAFAFEIPKINIEKPVDLIEKIAEEFFKEEKEELKIEMRQKILRNKHDTQDHIKRLNNEYERRARKDPEKITKQDVDDMFHILDSIDRSEKHIRNLEVMMERWK